MMFKSVFFSFIVKTLLIFFAKKGKFNSTCKISSAGADSFISFSLSGITDFCAALKIAIANEVGPFVLLLTFKNKGISFFSQLPLWHKSKEKSTSKDSSGTSFLSST